MGGVRNDKYLFHSIKRNIFMEMEENPGRKEASRDTTEIETIIGKTRTDDNERVYSCVLLVWVLVRTTGDWIDTLRAA